VDTRARVVDYKVGRPAAYGKSNRKERLLAGGERLQLPIYALAARGLGAREVASEYVFVEPPRGRDRVEAVVAAFDPARTEEAVASLVRVLALASDLVSAGRYLPWVESLKWPRPCDTCAFSAVCGPGHEALYERKWKRDARGPGEGAAFRALKEIP
jgi:hypothetical protein